MQQAVASLHENNTCFSPLTRKRLLESVCMEQGPSIFNVRGFCLRCTTGGRILFYQLFVLRRNHFRLITQETYEVRSLIVDCKETGA